MTRIYDLSQIPLPDVIEVLDFETLLEERKAALLDQFPEEQRQAVADVLALESEPLTKYLEENCYRELILRQRINEAAVAGMLASNRGADLDGVAARYNVFRLPGESDERLRYRAQLAFYQVAAAGPRERYITVAMAAHVNVKEVDAWQESPGVVRVAVLTQHLSDSGELTEEQTAIGKALFGAAPTETQSYTVGTSTTSAYTAARERLLADDVWPLGVDLRVTGPDITTYTIEATVIVPRGPDPAKIHTAAQAQIDARVKALASFRVDIHRNALIEALLPDGARTVALTSPAQDIPRGPGEIAVCTAVNITVEVQDD